MKEVDFVAYAAWLAERKATMPAEAPANGGAARLPGKRALLKELEDSQREKGRTPAFQAAY